MKIPSGFNFWISGVTAAQSLYDIFGISNSGITPLTWVLLILSIVNIPAGIMRQREERKEYACEMSH